MLPPSSADKVDSRSISKHQFKPALCCRFGLPARLFSWRKEEERRAEEKRRAGAMFSCLDEDSIRSLETELNRDHRISLHPQTCSGVRLHLAVRLMVRKFAKRLSTESADTKPG